MKIVQETGLDKDIEFLHEHSTFPMKPHVQQHFERIDARIQDVQLRAEKKCAAGHVEWSPQVKKAYELVEFWSMAVDSFKGKPINR